MHFDDIAALQFLNYSDKIYVLKHTRLTTHLNGKMRKLIPHCRNNKKKTKQTNEQKNPTQTGWLGIRRMCPNVYPRNVVSES